MGSSSDDDSGESDHENEDADCGSDIALSDDELQKGDFEFVVIVTSFSCCYHFSSTFKNISSSDNIKVKDRSLKRAEILKRKGKGTGVLTVEAEEPEAEDDFFEDAPPFDENTTFNQMNLSRPLLKVSCSKILLNPKSTVLIKAFFVNSYVWFVMFIEGYRCNELCSSYSDSSCYYTHGSSRQRYLWLCCNRYRKDSSIYASCLRATSLSTSSRQHHYKVSKIC